MLIYNRNALVKFRDVEYEKGLDGREGPEQMEPSDMKDMVSRAYELDFIGASIASTTTSTNGNEIRKIGHKEMQEIGIGCISVTIKSLT